MVPIDYFDLSVDAHADAPAVLDGNAVVSYRELQQVSCRIAQRLSAVGAGPMSRPIAVYAPNSARVIAATLGVMRAGGIVLPLHAQGTPETTVALLAESQARAVLYAYALRDTVSSIRSRVVSVTDWICLDVDEEILPPLDPVAVERAQRWIDAGGNRTRPVYYWPTSGSTGDPKIVVCDAGAFDLTLRVMQPIQHAATGDLRPVSLVATPLSHSAGPQVFTMLTLGATIVLANEFDTRAILDAIERHRVTELWLPPTALSLLLREAGLQRHDLSSVRQLALGAAAATPEQLRAACAVFGPRVFVIYGQIEAGPVTILDADTLAAAVAGDHPERLTSCGRSIGLNRIAIVNEEGAVLPPDEVGEIVVRGGAVKHYLDSALTAATQRGGWHHTGDLGYFDQAGYLYLVGRVRDVINIAGFKVPAAEIERVILELPAVRECAVVPAADPIRGEVARAIVVCDPPYALDAQAIAAHCRQRLGPRKTPRHIEQWPELPRSPAGKIDKRALRRTPAGSSSAASN